MSYFWFFEAFWGKESKPSGLMTRRSKPKGADSKKPQRTENCKLALELD